MTARWHPALKNSAKRISAVIAGCSLLVSGCGVVAPPADEKGADSQTSPSAPGGIWAQAIKDSDPGEGKFLEASKPIVEAVASRDYATFHQWLSSHALAKMREDQFYPMTDESPNAKPPVVLQNVTKEQFMEWMQKMEKVLGAPKSVRHPFVTSIDPQELSGKGDGITTMYALGGITADVPANIRKAAVRAQINCVFPQEPKEAGPKEAGEDADDGPYLNLKFVLVEEEGYLRVGYFEFMGPSLLD